MSPASYLTAPPRGVAPIVAAPLRWSRCGTGRSGARSSSLFWRELRLSCCLRCVCGRRGETSGRDAPGRLEPARRLLPEGRGRRGEGRCGERHDGRARDERRAPPGLAGATRRPARGARRGDGYRRAGGRLPPLQVIVAAVDLGSNTTRLLVGRVEGGRLDELPRETRIPALGEGVASRRRLPPLPIARVRNVLPDYRRTAESLGADRTLL